MRMGVGVVLGFALGVLALGLILYSTGRLVLTGTATPAHALPVPSAPDPAIPIPAAAPLPPPPNPALTAAPPEPEAMLVHGTLHATTKQTAPDADGSIGLPLPNLKASSIQDTFHDKRDGGEHEASDIMAPRGTPVFAVVEGNVVKLFNSKKGGITVYQYDNSQKYCYYYAHLDRYADGLKEGMLLRKGDTLGYVGSTGDAQANNPHLHFAILELGPDKHWYEHTTARDPYPLLMKALASN